MNLRKSVKRGVLILHQAFGYRKISRKSKKDTKFWTITLKVLKEANAFKGVLKG